MSLNLQMGFDWIWRVLIQNWQKLILTNALMNHIRVWYMYFHSSTLSSKIEESLVKLDGTSLMHLMNLTSEFQKTWLSFISIRRLSIDKKLCHGRLYDIWLVKQCMVDELQMILIDECSSHISMSILENLYLTKTKNSISQKLDLTIRFLIHVI